MLDDLAWPSLRNGAAVAATIGVVVTLVVGFIDPADGSPLLLLATLGVLIGFLAGGAVSAAFAPNRPATHGAVAALMAYLVVQTVGIIRRMVVGDDLSWLSYIYFGLLATTTGLVGGYLGRLILARRASLAARER